MQRASRIDQVKLDQDALFASISQIITYDAFSPESFESPPKPKKSNINYEAGLHRPVRPQISEMKFLQDPAIKARGNSLVDEEQAESKISISDFEASLNKDLMKIAENNNKNAVPKPQVKDFKGQAKFMR
jgi:hypothetical protein